MNLTCVCMRTCKNLGSLKLSVCYAPNHLRVSTPSTYDGHNIFVCSRSRDILHPYSAHSEESQIFICLSCHSAHPEQLLQDPHLPLPSVTGLLLYISPLTSRIILAVSYLPSLFLCLWLCSACMPFQGQKFQLHPSSFFHIPLPHSISASILF